MQVDAGQVCILEKSLVGSYSSDVRLQDEAARLIFSGEIDVTSLITHRYPLNYINDAIHQASNPTENSLKIMVNCKSVDE